MDSIIIMVIHNRWPWRKKDRVRDTVNEEVILKDREKEKDGGLSRVSVFEREMSRLWRVCCSVGGFLIVMTAVRLQV